MNKMYKKVAVVVFTLTIFNLAIAQEATTTPAAATTVYSKIPSISLGAGVLIFNGDLGKGNELSYYSKIRTGFNLGIEQRIGKIIGISLNGLMGKLAETERSKTANRNFESNILQGDLNLMIRLDRLLPNANLTPYIGAGVGFLTFDPYGDLLDKDGKTYHYWLDGGIRDKVESNANIPTASILARDYTYETQLKDSIDNYSRSSIYIPLTLGFKLKLTDNLDANIAATYHYALTDYLDNVKASGDNDSYFYTNVSLTYNFSPPSGPDAQRYQAIDFGKIEDGDSDADGIKDAKDKCAGTPKGVKTDSDGCPIDTDKDGIADYQDKEPNSKKGAMVDAAGVTLSDEVLAKKQAEWEASGAERSDAFNAKPSQQTIDEIEKQALDVRNKTGKGKSLPKDFIGADFNGDGFIQANEINKVIDGFFSGENDFTVERINRLIDFFFEQ